MNNLKLNSTYLHGTINPDLIEERQQGGRTFDYIEAANMLAIINKVTTGRPS